MRADATHRFEFEVDGGKRPPFACLARTHAEAEQIARNAGAPVQLRSRVPMPARHPHSDAAARAHLMRQGLLRHPWRDDVMQVVGALDHLRFNGGSVSVVPVAFLPPAEFLARGLQACPNHGTAHHPQGLRAVEPPAELSVRIVEDGGWELHLRQRRPHAGLQEALDWEACPDHGCGALGIAFEPACSVWTIVLEVLGALTFAAGLRPGELSAVPISAHEHPA
ncbi:MAG: hypothetical protein ACQEWM_03645 [Actinomycetota bacterium]